MNPRKAAVLAAERVLSQGAYSNLVWRTALDDVPPAERPFATALFYGTLERAYSLGLALRGYLTQPPSKLDSLTRAVLLTGMYQLAFMNIPGHAAVSETVAICRSVGRSRQSGFVNGVLRAFLRDGAAIPAPADPTDALAAAYSCPPALVRSFQRDYGADAALRILQGSLGGADTTLRVNPLRTTPDALARSLSEAGFDPKPFPGLPGALSVRGDVRSMPGADEGLFHVEDAAAQYAAVLLEPQPGETVVDVCAAPGGKTFTLAGLMHNEGTVFAFDVAPQRARLVADGAARLGMTCVRAIARDGRTPDERLTGCAQRVLCDLPCSGLGVLRRKPELRMKSLPTGLEQLQRELLDASAEYVAPGGVLVYSTCTLRRAENEDTACAFLAAHPDFEPYPIPDLPGCDLFRGGGGSVTFLPGPTDGFFAARFRRKSAEGGEKA